jgi:hypothetical protein
MLDLHLEFDTPGGSHQSLVKGTQKLATGLEARRKGEGRPVRLNPVGGLPDASTALERQKVG